MASISTIATYFWITLILTSLANGEAFYCPANTSSISADPIAAVAQAFPNINIVKPIGNPALGWQNYSYCCILAAGQFLNQGCNNTEDVAVKGLQPDSQFPCGAQYSQDGDGTALIEVSYAWTQQYCPGWQISSPNNLNQWFLLLVGFILPSVVYCLSIPRRRKLKVSSYFFPRSINSCQIIVALLGTAAALVIVVVDTILWLFTVFAIAAPALLSALYEAYLDKRTINFVEKEAVSRNLPLALRARLLFTVLCGNLDLYPAWSDTMHLAADLDPLDQQRLSPRGNKDRIIEDLLSKVAADEASPLMVPPAEAHVQEQAIETRSEESRAPDRVWLREATSITDKVASRLTAMLACQYSYGSFCGGPVLFYVASFLYALLEIREEFGDRDNAHALSFGIWYMTIPLISIVSGCLLGGNNPSTLQGIMSTEISDYEVGGASMGNNLLRRTSTYKRHHEMWSTRKLFSKMYERVYEAAYKPASIWNRARSKQSWLLVLYADTLLRYRHTGKDFDDQIRPAMENLLIDVLFFRLWDWIFLTALAFVLVFVPCCFSFLLSFFTPQFGVSCRSLTCVIFVCAQTLLLFLWVIRTTWRNRYWRQGLRARNASFSSGEGELFWREIRALREMAQADTTMPSETMSRSGPEDEENQPQGALRKKAWHHARFDKRTQRRLWNVVYKTFILLGWFTSVFSAIGGTLMQVTNIYENGICKMNVDHWLPGHREGVLLQLSTNSRDAVKMAKNLWMVAGSLSVAYLVICSYAGWLYQTRLRRHFRAVATRLNE